MRLWHHKLIPVLPRQQLLGQHREVCALRGLGWGRKHSTVDYVFLHSWEHLYHYHILVMDEMKARGYSPNPKWADYYYRGKRCDPLVPEWVSRSRSDPLYPEHDHYNLIGCAGLLRGRIRKRPDRYTDQDKYRLSAWLSENNFQLL